MSHWRDENTLKLEDQVLSWAKSWLAELGWLEYCQHCFWRVAALGMPCFLSHSLSHDAYVTVTVTENPCDHTGSMRGCEEQAPL